MYIESSIYINKKRGEVYEAVKNIEDYFRFMLNVENVKIIGIKRNCRLSEWKINVYETPISWQQQEYLNDKDYQIKFKCLKGDLAHFEGSWQVQQEDSRSKLNFYLRLNWGGTLALRYNNEFINRKLLIVIKAMLWAFKKKLDYGTEIVKGDAIVSELIHYKNRDGKNIVGYFDHLRNWSKDGPLVILCPGYGETKRDTLSTSYYLVKNGFNCIRYDATDHVGESDGEIANTTLTKLKKNLVSTLDYLEKAFAVNKVGVVATSLAKRMAIKAAAEDKRIAFLCGMVGVVNLQDTLKSIYKEDMVGAFLKGEKWGPTDMLGHKVIFENFLGSAVKDDFHSLESTFKDVSTLDIPIVFLVAEKDVWVRAEEVRLVFEKTKGKIKEFHIIPEVMHQLQENPKIAQLVLKQIVVSCTKYLMNKELGMNEVIEPNLREIAVQNRIEKERLKLREVFTLSLEKDFWAEYLSSFSMIYKVPDYREYLTLLFELSGGLKDGDFILDAGCGVGYFGGWLINEIIKSNNSDQNQSKLYSRCRYYGVDFVRSALDIANSKHLDMKKRFLEKKGLNNGKPDNFFPCEYIEHDLNFDLPFKDRYFNKICCSLVLSYVAEPILATRELFRTLKHGGKIVVSSLKPFADLSEVYRNFISIAKSEQEISEARRLLSEIGRIRQKEGMGHYRFFSEREIKFILLAAGGKKVKVFKSLGNQVNVAVASKE